MVFVFSMTQPEKALAVLMTPAEYKLNKEAGLIKDGVLETALGDHVVLIALGSTHQTFELVGDVKE